MLLCVTCESRVICHFSSSEFRGNKAKTDKFYMFMLLTGFFAKHNKRTNNKTTKQERYLSACATSRIVRTFLGLVNPKLLQNCLPMLGIR